MSNQVVHNTDINSMPALAMRGLVIYPGMILHFDVGRDKSVAALRAAMDTDRRIFLVTQREISVNDPTLADVYKIGVVAEIRQILKTTDSTMRVLVEGMYKATVLDIEKIDPHLVFSVRRLEVKTVRTVDSKTQALVRSVKNAFEQYGFVSPKMPKELLESIQNEENPSKLFDSIVFNVLLGVEDKQKLLEAPTAVRGLELLMGMLLREAEILAIEKRIHEQVREQIDKNQREYYLREQMRIIASQLGETDSPQEEAYDYMDRIDHLKLSEEVSDKLYKEAEKLLKMPQSSHEASVIRTYLDACLELPWNTETKDKLDIAKAQQRLDRDHYGLKTVKDRILEILAVRALTPDVKGQIICLVGPPGIGKTSIGRSIARALGRKYARISLGGVKDESDIRGHRKTYIGAMPGRIINAIKTAKSRNPLILLDEIDKMSNDYRGDPSSALLEVLDSEQNVAFRDHYIEVPFDLSDVLFVTTANSLDTIPAPLLDRMEVIELPSYTREEKFNIAKHHLLPKQLKKNGLKASLVKIPDAVLYALIDFYTREAGVRKLERAIAGLCRKAAKLLVSGEQKRVTFTSANLEKYMGPKKYRPDLASERDEVGMVNGLAWTSVGGVLMPLEVLILEGSGKIELTGSLGDVMKESARIAVSYVRSVAREYGIAPDFYKTKDIHIHAPEGAVPKDGPSAGVTLATALVSALSGNPVRHDVAMTGEITLRGKVLPIGGLREKTMAAYKAELHTVVIPKDNEPDLAEIDETVRGGLEFVLAEDLRVVLKTALAMPVTRLADAPVVGDEHTHILPHAIPARENEVIAVKS